MRVRIEQRGTTVTGKPTFYIVALEDGKNKWGKAVKEGEDMTGFWLTMEAAWKEAAKNGWSVEENKALG